MDVNEITWHCNDLLPHFRDLLNHKILRTFLIIGYITRPGYHNCYTHSDIVNWESPSQSSNNYIVNFQK